MASPSETPKPIPPWAGTLFAVVAFVGAVAVGANALLCAPAERRSSSTPSVKPVVARTLPPPSPPRVPPPAGRRGAQVQPGLGVWDGTTELELRTELRRQAGRPLSPVAEERLLRALAQLQGAPPARLVPAGEPAAALRDRLKRTGVLAEVDKVFRQELGMSASQFVQALGREQVRQTRRRPVPSEAER